MRNKLRHKPQAKVHGTGRGSELALLLIFAMIVGIKLVRNAPDRCAYDYSCLNLENVAPSMREYVIFSALLGGAIAVAGAWIGAKLHFLPGPSVVLLGLAVFLVSIAIKRRPI